MQSFRELLRRGDPAIWAAGTGLGVCVLMILGMIGLILWNGLGFFWPKPLVQLTLADGSVALGELTAREPIPSPGNPAAPRKFRVQLKLGNRDVTGVDFKWIEEDQITARSVPGDALYIERREYGPFIGQAVKLTEAGTEVASGSEAVIAALPPLVAKAAKDREALRDLELGEIGAVNYAIEQARLRGRKLDLELRRNPGVDQTQARAAIDQEMTALKTEYAALEEQLGKARDAAQQAHLTVRTAAGDEKEIPVLDVFRFYAANRLGTWNRLSPTPKAESFRRSSAP
jgi:phosphate transport system permease protein